MVVPCLAIMLGIGIFPLIFSIGISFIRWEPKIPGRPFVWFANYKDILTSIEFWTAMRTTAVIVIVSVTLEFFFGLRLALIMAGKVRGKRLYMAILILPVMMVPVVVGYTWRILWHPTYGPINQILSWFVGHRVMISWLTQTKTAFFALIVTELWQWTPFMFLLLLAGLKSLPVELFESARIDGASSWQIFRYVTLPLLKPIIAIAIIIRFMDAFREFDKIFQLTGGGPGVATETISLFIYRNGFRYFKMGYASALSYLTLIIIVAFSMIYIKALRRSAGR